MGVLNNKKTIVTFFAGVFVCVFMYSILLKYFEQIFKHETDYNDLDIARMDGGGIQSSSNLDNKLILVNAYMRSGSTFLGGLLGHQEKIFYFYEPLHKMISWNYLNGTNLCKYTEPVCTERPGVREEALDYLEDLFNCTMRPHEKSSTRNYTPVKDWQVQNGINLENAENQLQLNHVWNSWRTTAESIIIDL
ncbi:hypothetical protein ACF0H5_022852 [Mactra antiquata]